MIYLLWCTANPQIFENTHKDWMLKTWDKADVYTKVAVDKKEHFDQLHEFDVVLVNNTRHGITTPLYELSSNLEAADNDIVVVPSDDFFPFQYWDKYLHEKMDGEEHIFKVNDGHMKNIISMPVMTFSALLRLNRIIYHPEYRHMYSDQELHDVAEHLGILNCARETDPIFEHRHYVYNKRPKIESDKVLNQWYDESLQLYLRRKQYPIQKKLTVNEL